MHTMTERLGTDALRKDPSQPMARGLGWLSLGLGIPALVAPGLSGRLIGLGDGPVPRTANRLAGVRELVNGAGILTRRDPAPWMWSRVAGDVVDLTLMTGAMASPNARRGRLAASLAVVAGLTAADYRTASRLSKQSVARSQRIITSATVNKPRQEVYDYWHDFTNLPQFMAHLERVEMNGTRSHWVATAPAGRKVEWDAETVDDQPGEAIAWRSKQGSLIQHSGRVEFQDAPGGRGTEVTVLVEYAPPGGPLGETLAKLFGEEPHQQIRDDLRRFKQVMETGEVVRSEGSPEGVRTRRQVRQHAAQPLPAEQSRRAA